MTVTLRPATMADARQLWQWRNDDEVRANSFVQDRVEWSDHISWLGRKLADGGCRLFVIALEGADAGQLRFDVVGSSAEVSISIAPSWRGHGVATGALRLSLRIACRQLGVTHVVAVVKEANVASARAFERAGFHLTERFVRRGCECRRYEWTTTAEALDD